MISLEALPGLAVPVLSKWLDCRHDMGDVEQKHCSIVRHISNALKAA